MPLRDAHRSLAVLMATCLALALAASLTACSGAPEERPAPATTAPPAAPQPTATPSPPPIATAAPTGTPSPTPVATAAPTATPSPTPVATAAPIATPSPTPTADAAPTETPSPPSTASPTPEAAPVETPSPTAFRYDTYDTTGAVAEPGSYAFLADPADTTSAVTTYEALRDGTTTALLIHKSDAHGASQAELYDAVEAGDTFEWRYADDCWTGYRVTEVRPDPPGTVPRKLLALEPYGYAYTGCSGVIAADASSVAMWREPPVWGGPDLAYPVVYGVFQVVPEGWTGELDLGGYMAAPGDSADNPGITESLTEARQLPYWRDLPGWTLDWASTGGLDAPVYGYCARLSLADRAVGVVEVCASHAAGRANPSRTKDRFGATVEVRVVNGYAALVSYFPRTSSNWSRLSPIEATVYNAAAESVHTIVGWSESLSGSNVGAVLAVARSLFEPPNPLPPPTTFRYDRYDATGAVAAPGSYAFLEDPADATSAVSTYEALRDGTTTALLIHATDADGVSRAAFLGTVQAGDDFEWRESDTCWVRYLVSAVLPDPPGDRSRKEFAIRRYSYSATGCAETSDAMAGAASFNWVPPNIQSITAPVRYGPYFMHPRGWTGDWEDVVRLDAQSTSDGETTATPGWPSEDPAEVRMHPLWRDPVLPAGWALLSAHAVEDWWVEALYTEADGYLGARVLILQPWWRPIQKEFIRNSNGLGHELRLIEGRPAVLWYHLDGQEGDVAQSSVAIFDETTGVEVVVEMFARVVRNDLEAIIAIARSLFEPPNPLPPPTAFRYDRYDTTGEVAEPGSYAFLADPADTTSAVTTYEALRDGTTTALLIHKSDAHGASQATLYDAVEAGDLFEWREADDCFVRYTVTEVQPDPAGTVPRKLLAVEWMTYAYTGCSGAVSASAVATVDWGELPDLGGASLAVPIVHGTAQLVPADWTGAMKAEELHAPPAFSDGNALGPGDLAVARQLPYWRDPVLPAGWTFGGAYGGGVDGPPYGYCADYWTASGGLGVEICGYHDGLRFRAREAHFADTGVVIDARMLAGRPARVLYTPEGSPHLNPYDPITVWVYDIATESVYRIHGIANCNVHRRC